MPWAKSHSDMNNHRYTVAAFQTRQLQRWKNFCTTPQKARVMRVHSFEELARGSASRKECSSIKAIEMCGIPPGEQILPFRTRQLHRQSNSTFTDSSTSSPNTSNRKEMFFVDTALGSGRTHATVHPLCPAEDHAHLFVKKFPPTYPQRHNGLRARS